MGEFICHRRLYYHQYADDTQLYSHGLGDAVDALSQCLEILEVWMETTGFNWTLARQSGCGRGRGVLYILVILMVFWSL